jgi:hypothetical protein
VARRTCVVTQQEVVAWAVDNYWAATLLAALNTTDSVTIVDASEREGD